MAAAKAFAELGGYRIELLHVAANGEGWAACSIMPISVVIPGESSHLHKELRQLKASFAASATAVRTLLIEGGSVSCNILAESEDIKADTIIIGGHSHRLLSRLLTGSVTSTVVNSAKCRVLVIPNVIQVPLPAAA